ncbi:hypothetical protein TKK_0002952 [Trichogramma kaykai]
MEKANAYTRLHLTRGPRKGNLSGHSTIVGLHLNKVLSYRVRSKDCRYCTLGHPTDDHDCRKNHVGSAKSMEPNMILVPYQQYAENLQMVQKYYTIPSASMSKGASIITGLSVIDGDLFLNEERLEASSAADAVNIFIQYIKTFEKQVILLAHNGNRFDTPRLLKLVKEVGKLDEFCEYVARFADSLPIFRKVSPERLICQNTQSISAILNSKVSQQIIACNKASLIDFKNEFSLNIIHKMASTGVNNNILVSTYEKGGKEAILLLFTGNLNGSPRITKNKKILDKVMKLFPTNQF